VTVIPADTPVTIEMDPQRLMQIIMNLLKNATKFTFKGIIRLRL
jgi:signal transduction histidine kinase